jgi:acyl dehydratase
VDVERAEKESPFGTTVAHGNLTLSLIDGLRLDLMRSTGFRLGVNCGWNRVRFPAPVPAGSRVQVESRHASQRPQAVGRARQLRRTVAVPADRTTKRRTTVTAMASSAYPSTGMTSGIRSNGIAE